MTQPAAKKLIKELSTHVLPVTPVAAGGSGARTIKSLLKTAKIDFIDTLEALDARLLMLTATWNAERDQRPS